MWAKIKCRYVRLEWPVSWYVQGYFHYYTWLYNSSLGIDGVHGIRIS